MSASQTDDSREVERLIGAARETIGGVPFCWVITPSGNRGANARVVKCQVGDDGEDFWTHWFLTPRIGRKATEIHEAGRVTLAYQHPSGEAYVAVAGPAELLDDRDAVEKRFRGSIYDDPEGKVAASLVAVRVRVDHLELHVRGVTTEPWGRGRTLLDRDPTGNWHRVD